jgi:glycerophosphoryl diester phosphodiesterase
MIRVLLAFGAACYALAPLAGAVSPAGAGGGEPGVQHGEADVPPAPPNTLIDVYDSGQIDARRPLLIAHRGGVVAPGTPECSKAALELAAAHGYDMVELDLQESKDRIPIVFHDQRLERACGVSGSVADYTAEELRTTRYMDNDEPIMTLDEALALCRALNLGVMLDVKRAESDECYEEIMRLLEDHGLLRATVCINGDPVLRGHFEGKIMLRLVDETAAASGGPASLEGYFWFGLPEHLPSEQVQALRQRGALVIPGINVFRYPADSHRADAKRDIERLLEAGVDGFQIDSAYQDYFGLPMAYEEEQQ